MITEEINGLKYHKKEFGNNDMQYRIVYSRRYKRYSIRADFCSHDHNTYKGALVELLDYFYWEYIRRKNLNISRSN